MNNWMTFRVFNWCVTSIVMSTIEMPLMNSNIWQILGVRGRGDRVGNNSWKCLLTRGLALKVCFHNHVDFSIISHTVVPIGILVVHIGGLNVTFVFVHVWILHTRAVAFLFLIFLCAAAAIFNLFQSGFQRKVVVSLNQAVSGTTVVTVRQDLRSWIEKLLFFHWQDFADLYRNI